MTMIVLIRKSANRWKRNRCEYIPDEVVFRFLSRRVLLWWHAESGERGQEVLLKKKKKKKKEKEKRKKLSQERIKEEGRGSPEKKIGY
jgi:hypothetical protein